MREEVIQKSRNLNSVVGRGVELTIELSASLLVHGVVVSTVNGWRGGCLSRGLSTRSELPNQETDGDCNSRSTDHRHDNGHNNAVVVVSVGGDDLLVGRSENARGNDD